MKKKTQLNVKKTTNNGKIQWMRHFQSFLSFYKCLWSLIHVAIS